MAGPQNFFRKHLEDFIRWINLDVIIPKLTGKELLTDYEYQTVTLVTSTENERKRKLGDILYDKPSHIPWIVLECLEDSTPQGTHKSLADVLRCYLQGCHRPDELQQFQPIDAQFPPDPLSTLHKLNQQYAGVIRLIAFSLQERGISINHILQTLSSVCTRDNIPLSLPSTVQDFPSLAVFLRERNLCHEYDTDLFCSLLKQISTPDYDRLLRYSESLFDTNVLQLDLLFGENSSSEHFIALTFHATPSMTLRDVLGIKNIFAHYLKIPRHSFSLKQGISASNTLIWQFPDKLYKHFTVTFEKDEVRFDLYEYDHGMTKIEVQHQTSTGTDKDVVFDQETRKRKRSAEISFITDGNDHPTKMSRVDSPGK